MSEKSVEGYVYRDLEKFYRVLGYYEGQEIKPVEIHQEFVDQNLEHQLRDPKEYIRRIQYDLQMTDVHVLDQIIFRTDKPEITLLYSLFSEGIQSLIVLRDLTAEEVKEWCLMIRQTLIAFDQGSPKDLASVLWRTPFRNLRTRVYNALMDLERANGGEQSDENFLSAWHERDQDWQIPEAENLSRGKDAAEAIEKTEFDKAKELLDSVEVVSKVPPALRLSTEEIRLLSDELSCFDQNHVEFNLMSLTLAALDPGRNVESPATQIIEELLGDLARSILARFHPGLTVLLVEEMKKLSGTKFSVLEEKIRAVIAETLLKPINQKRLQASLKDPERAKVSKKLLPLIDPKQFPAIVDFYLSENDFESLEDFLKVVCARPLPHEKIFFSWGEERLAEVLPAFKNLNWPEKIDFLTRALRSPYKKLVKEASNFLVLLKVAAPQALQIYRAAETETKELWMKNLNENRTSENWKTFLVQIFQTGAFSEVGDLSLRQKLISGWAEVAIKYFGPEVRKLFAVWIEARKLWFWPKYPDIREALLLGVTAKRELKTHPEVQSWLQREASLPFQTAELKQILAGIRAK